VQPDVGFAAKRDPSSAARNIPNHPPPSFSKARASPSTVLVYAHEHLGEVFHDFARQRECEIKEGKLLLDHVHMMISIPPKYSVAQVVGFIKGKSAINIARTYMGRKRNFKGQHFWARGYFVSTVGVDEETIQKYIEDQEDEDRRFDQQELF